MTEASAPPSPPPEVAEHAALTVAYVERAIGVRLTYDSETLSVLDHYLRAVPTAQQATVALVATTAGAYFGEVVRNHIGGRWDVSSGAPETWRFVVPSGLSFVPARFALAAILRGDGGEGEEPAEIDAPALLRTMLDDATSAMAEVTEETYYSLAGRLDTLEHLHEVVAAYAAQAIERRQGDVDIADGDADDDDDDEADASPPLPH